ncbi:AraC family transcriptional regulator [Mycobacterium saskatchewanense]|uniref:AraC-like ligand-binding domain-containing protein n=1 Tax=Mycobacterium saskatchewanense TaxID=220927 RepID=UPI000A16A28A|nr:helix-turn-helix domain-containing protein [Mycobacterium saskatchewanense]BBX63323.1 AraC family transcriptional regulator [Mycobacterium saskatchewanense]
MGIVTTAAERHFEAFRSAVSDTFVPLSLSVDDRSNFEGRLRSANLGTVQLSEVDVAAKSLVVRRTSRLIRQSTASYLKVGVQVAGRSSVFQDGRETVLTPGDLVVYDTSRPYELRFAESYRVLVVMLPTPLLRLPIPQLGHLTARVISGRSGLGALVSQFLLRVGTGVLDGEHEGNPHVAEAIIDLLAAALIDNLPGEVRHSDAGRRAQLTRVRAYIERELGNPALDVSAIAAANRMSVRYLQKLFEKDGETVTGWVRARRLEQCRRDLTDCRYLPVPVSSVAARWGLVNAAHFSRLFKKSYGVSPTEYRAFSLASGPVRDLATSVREGESASSPTLHEWS